MGLVLALELIETTVGGGEFLDVEGAIAEHEVKLLRDGIDLDLNGDAPLTEVRDVVGAVGVVVDDGVGAIDDVPSEGTVGRDVGA